MLKFVNVYHGYQYFYILRNHTQEQARLEKFQYQVTLFSSYINLRINFYTKLIKHIMPDSLAKFYNILSSSSSTIYKYESLLFMNSCIAGCCRKMAVATSA